MVYMPYNAITGRNMTEFTVIAYEKENGESPVEDFINGSVTRVLYFFCHEGRIILTNGFVKKTQKTPPEEIRLAKERRADYIERME